MGSPSGPHPAEVCISSLIEGCTYRTLRDLNISDISLKTSTS